MKQILFFTAVLVSISSCVNQRQKGSSIGRADEVYFTPSDIRIKVSDYEKTGSNSEETKAANTKNYTDSYSDRLSNFGSTNRFNYSNYQPVLVPSAMYSSYSGWGIGMSYGAYSNPYYSHCGCNYSPYNYWGAGYNNYYNPYMYTNHPFGYGYYGSGYSNNGYGTSTSSNYSRRTGTYNPSSTNPSSTRADGNSNGGSARNNSNPTGRWYNTTSGSGSTSNSSSSSGSSRGSSGTSSGSTSSRRR